MDSIIPIIIMALGFAYSVYTNRQKEIEKARKRTFKPEETEAPEAPKEIKSVRDFFDVLVEELEGKVEPTNKPTKRQEPAPTPVPTPTATVAGPSPFGAYEGTLTEHPRSATSRKNSQSLLQAVEIEDLDDIKRSTRKDNSSSSSSTSVNEDFDLRQALIHSIILDRPYK